MKKIAQEQISKSQDVTHKDHKNHLQVLFFADFVIK